ncbi:unnamed protein product [Caenorhabditis angaria]|uniref:phospholipase A2 n=1 Tax=Caenorhabditis angaria TaxID=860376 RepID=A0A9P1N9A4_9PELO|nr:unnamed protein product [Caenorhabditis angaria]
MNFLKLATSKEAMDLFNAARNTVAQMTARATPQRDKFPKAFDKKYMKRVVTEHSNLWFTCEMKDGGFAFVYKPGDWLAFYSPQLSDLDVMKIFYTDFVEISERKDAVNIINKIVEMIVANPESDPLYYAVATGLNKYVGQRVKQSNGKILNDFLTKNDETPAHIAAIHNQDIIRILVGNGFDLTKQTKDGNNIAHCAAQNLLAIKAIRESIQDEEFLKLITTENKKKETAIHLMIQYDNVFEYVLQYCPQAFAKKYDLPLIGILESYQLEDIKQVKEICQKLKVFDPQFADRPIKSDGSTILHVALKAKVLKTILNEIPEASIDIKDFNGKSPLHAAVLRADLEDIIALISYGANLNSRDSSGQTPLEYAVKKDDEKSVKALLLFNAETDGMDKVARSQKIRRLLESGSIKYYENETRAFKWQEDSLDHIALKKTVEKLASADSLTQFYNAISFDGGGIRGLVSLQILRELSNRFGDSFLQSFRTLGGTSTGSIVILAIAKYQNIDKVMKLYLRLKDDIFSGTRPYNGQVLEEKLLAELGNLTLSDIGKHKEMRLAITVTRVDVSPPKLEVFRSFSIPPNIRDDRFTKLENWTAAKVARCSSAAPTYFPSVDGKYMDGGIIANNPTCEILCDQQAITLLLPEAKSRMKIILSVGTGKTPTKKAENVDLSLGQNSIAGIVSSLNSIVHMKNVFVDQLTSADGVNVDRARMMSSSMDIAFFRFSPQLSQEYELDEVRAENLIEMMWETKLYMHTRHNDINILLSLMN